MWKPPPCLPETTLSLYRLPFTALLEITHMSYRRAFCLSPNQVEAKTIRPYTGRSGFYCSCAPVASAVMMLRQLRDAAGLPHIDDDEMHCTTMYSPTAAPRSVMGAARDHIQTTATGIAVFGPRHDYLVLTLQRVPALVARHRQWVAQGCVPTFPDYEPHITLAPKFEAQPVHLRLLRQWLAGNGPLRITLGPEQPEDVKP